MFKTLYQLSLSFVIFASTVHMKRFSLCYLSIIRKLTRWNSWLDDLRSWRTFCPRVAKIESAIKNIGLWYISGGKMKKNQRYFILSFFRISPATMTRILICFNKYIDVYSLNSYYLITYHYSIPGCCTYIQYFLYISTELLNPIKTLRHRWSCWITHHIHLATPRYLYQCKEGQLTPRKDSQLCQCCFFWYKTNPQPS